MQFHGVECLSCSSVRSFESFSAYQLSRGRLAKCQLCVHGQTHAERQAKLHGAAAGHRRVQHAVAIKMREPMPQSAHRWLVHGEYTDGTPCVVKWFRHYPRCFEDIDAPPNYEKSLISADLEVAQRAERIAAQWNAAHGSGAVCVRINVPTLLAGVSSDGRQRTCWQTQQGGPTAPAAIAGQQCLVEPLLPSFHKWTSSTGWRAAGCPPWCEALGHFSWVASGGESLLCSCKGCELPDEGACVLSDPTIHSRGQTCGPTDLGLDGIRTFFARHVCNELCRRWPRPDDAAQPSLPMLRETAMAREVGLPSSVVPAPLVGERRAPPLPAAGDEGTSDAPCGPDGTSVPVYVPDGTIWTACRYAQKQALAATSAEELAERRMRSKLRECGEDPVRVRLVRSGFM